MATLTDKTVANTYDQLWFRGATQPGATDNAVQVLTTENDGTDDLATPLYLGTARIGIGTSSPTVELDVTGATAISGALTVGGNIDFNSGTIDLSTQTVAVTLSSAANALNFGSNTLTIDASANRVGIGTAAPSVPLHIALGEGTDPTYGTGTLAVFQNNDDASDDCNITLVSGTAGNSRVLFGDSGDDDIGMIDYDNNINSMGFGTTDSVKMTILTGGNVGIGTGTPGAPLEIMRQATAGTAPLEVLRLGVKDIDSSVTTTAGEGPSIDFYIAEDTIQEYAGRIAVVREDVSETVASGAMVFHTSVDDESPATTERMRIASDGKVGIGVTAPESTLHIKGNLGLIIEDDTDASGLGEAWHFQTDSTGQLNAQYSTNCSSFSTLWTCEANGNFGIGTTSPAQNLHIAKTENSATGGACLLIHNEQGSGDTNAGIMLRRNQGVDWTIENNNGDLYCEYGNALTTLGSGTNALTIKGDTGNVGIGETAPNVPLHVTGIANTNSDQLDHVDDRSEVKIQYRADAEAAMYFGGLGSNKGYIQGTDDDGSHAYDISINPYGGNVGIGTNAPDAPLSIKSSGASSVLQSYIKSSDTNHIIEFEEGGAGQGIIEVKNASGGTAKIRLDGAGDTWFNGGDVGIGTTAPAYPLEVAGSGTDEYVALFDNTGSDAASHGIKIMAGDSDHADSTTVYLSFYESDAGAVGDVDSDGGTLAFSDASDERLKKNIRDTELNALSGINSLQMRDFEWKKSGKTIECGLIAQELETVYPHLVKQFDDADKTYGIRKTGFIYVLMKAVQELSAKVTALENA